VGKACLAPDRCGDGRFQHRRGLSVPTRHAALGRPEPEEREGIYGRIAEEKAPVMRLFVLWARLTFAKDWLSFPDESVLTKDPGMAAELAAMSKGDFFDQMLRAVYHADRWHLPSR